MSNNRLRVLVLEDSTTQTKIIKRLLLEHDCQVFVAHSAREAFSSGELYEQDIDVMLVDIHFGEANGIDLLGPLQRRWPDAIRIVMTTDSKDDFGGLARAREAGAHLVLRKPFGPGECAETLQDVRNLLSTGERREHVVVLDDSKTAGKIASNLLSSFGYRVSVFQQAEDAIQRLNYDHVDVVLTDVFMPGMSGHEVIQLVRDVWPEVGVVAMTGGTHGGDQTRPALDRELQKSKLLGADGVLLKPYAPPELKRAIRDAESACLSRKREQALKPNIQDMLYLDDC